MTSPLEYEMAFSKPYSIIPQELINADFFLLVPTRRREKSRTVFPTSIAVSDPRPPNSTWLISGGEAFPLFILKTHKEICFCHRRRGRKEHQFSCSALPRQQILEKKRRQIKKLPGPGPLFSPPQTENILGWDKRLASICRGMETKKYQHAPRSPSGGGLGHRLLPGNRDNSLANKQWGFSQLLSPNEDLPSSEFHIGILRNYKRLASAYTVH